MALVGYWDFWGNTGIILLGYNVNKAIVNHPQIDHKWMVYNHQHMNG
jgi:hypothetical protein